MFLAGDAFDNIKQRILMMKDVNETEIHAKSTFSSLNFDSLDFIEIQILAQECYDIKIPDELFHQQALVTIDDMVSYIATQKI